MAKIAHDALEMHADDRLILDDQHIGAGLPGDIGQRRRHQLAHGLGIYIEQPGGILDSEALHGAEQQRLPRQRHHGGQPGVGDGFKAAALRQREAGLGAGMG